MKTKFDIKIKWNKIMRDQIEKIYIIKYWRVKLKKKQLKEWWPDMIDKKIKRELYWKKYINYFK